MIPYITQSTRGPLNTAQVIWVAKNWRDQQGSHMMSGWYGLVLKNTHGQAIKRVFLPLEHVGWVGFLTWAKNAKLWRWTIETQTMAEVPWKVLWFPIYLCSWKRWQQCKLVISARNEIIMYRLLDLLKIIRHICAMVKSRYIRDGRPPTFSDGILIMGI